MEENYVVQIHNKLKRQQAKAKKKKQRVPNILEIRWDFPFVDCRCLKSLAIVDQNGGEKSTYSNTKIKR